MAEAQYQPEPDIFIEPDDIPPATPGPVAAKFDQNVAVGIDLPFVPDGHDHLVQMVNQYQLQHFGQI